VGWYSILNVRGLCKWRH